MQGPLILQDSTWLSHKPIATKIGHILYSFVTVGPCGPHPVRIEFLLFAGCVYWHVVYNQYRDRVALANFYICNFDGNFPSIIIAISSNKQSTSTNQKIWISNTVLSEIVIFKFQQKLIRAKLEGKTDFYFQNLIQTEKKKKGENNDFLIIAIYGRIPAKLEGRIQRPKKKIKN